MTRVASEYPPSEDTFLMERCILNYRVKSYLDMGSGSGYLARSYKNKYKEAEVWMADIIDYGIRFEDIYFVKSDLFENINRKFDMISFNAPYLEPDGYDYDVRLINNGVVQRFVDQVGNYINKNGIALLLVNHQTKVKLDWDIEAIENYFFEKLIVYKKIF